MLGISVQSLPLSALHIGHTDARLMPLTYIFYRARKDIKFIIEPILPIFMTPNMVKSDSQLAQPHLGAFVSAILSGNNQKATELFEQNLYPIALGLYGEFNARPPGVHLHPSGQAESLLFERSMSTFNLRGVD